MAGFGRARRGYPWRANDGKDHSVGIGTSIFLIALGAILKYAVTATVSGIALNTVGVILMIVGAIGLLISLLWMTIWADRTRGTAVVERDVAPQREVLREREV